mmetsp:Transcript_106226/g.298720  ORF Transcript_106226/g.298720 Transcript_106226/m.298720 type:complete len:402 (+) Transcript_106226:117-1322(+)
MSGGAPIGVTGGAHKNGRFTITIEERVDAITAAAAAGADISTAALASLPGAVTVAAAPSAHPAQAEPPAAQRGVVGADPVPVAAERAPAGHGEVEMELFSILKESFEAQHSLVTQTAEKFAKKVQVYQQVCQQSLPQNAPDAGIPAPQQTTRPSTPTSMYTTSSCTSRTPPCANGARHSTAARIDCGGERMRRVAGTAATGIVGGVLPGGDAEPAVDNLRENTYQMWNAFGSTLQKVVDQNRQLENENQQLEHELQGLQQQVDAAREALARTHNGCSDASSSTHPPESPMGQWPGSADPERTAFLDVPSTAADTGSGPTSSTGSTTGAFATAAHSSSPAALAAAVAAATTLVTTGSTHSGAAMGLPASTMSGSTTTSTAVGAPGGLPPRAPAAHSDAGRTG